DGLRTAGRAGASRRRSVHRGRLSAAAGRSRGARRAARGTPRVRVDGRALGVGRPSLALDFGRVGRAAARMPAGAADAFLVAGHAGAALLHATALVPALGRRSSARRAVRGSHSVFTTGKASMTTVPETWSIGSVLRWATEDFARRGLARPRLEAELLLGHVLGVDRVRLVIDADRPLRPDELGSFREVILRRRRGEPVAYIRGEREFYGRRFVVDRRVLVPRPETETLVEVALERTRERSLFGRALDLCTGSGCVAVTFALERPTWKIT